MGPIVAFSTWRSAVLSVIVLALPMMGEKEDW